MLSGAPLARSATLAFYKILDSAVVHFDQFKPAQVLVQALPDLAPVNFWRGEAAEEHPPPLPHPAAEPEDEEGGGDSSASEAAAPLGEAARAAAVAVEAARAAGDASLSESDSSEGGASSDSEAHGPGSSPEALPSPSSPGDGAASAASASSPGSARGSGDDAPVADPPPAAPVPLAARAFPGGRRAHTAWELPRGIGVLKYDERLCILAAHCPIEEHGVCRLNRTLRAAAAPGSSGARLAQGRPLGVLLAWLSAPTLRRKPFRTGSPTRTSAGPPSGAIP